MIKFGTLIKVEEIKAAGDDWEVSGYASTFGNVDLGYDVIMPGAFDKTLSDGHRIGFFHSHDPRMVLGVPKSLKTDKAGLLGRFKISKTTLGADTHQLLKDDAFGGFSIGYWAKETDYTDNGEVRQIHELELVEVSLVATPMNPEAVITGVKDYLAQLGITAGMTLAEKAHVLSDGLNQLLSDTRQFVGGADRPLSNTKRQELTELLEMFSGLDAVRSDLKTVLTAAPMTSRVSGKRALYELSESRKRLAHILKETN